MAGFAVIEPRDLADAIEKVSLVPSAVAQGVVDSHGERDDRH